MQSQMCTRRERSDANYRRIVAGSVHEVSYATLPLRNEGERSCNISTKKYCFSRRRAPELLCSVCQERPWECLDPQRRCAVSRLRCPACHLVGPDSKNRST